MRFIVTGATGFIGRRLVSRLVAGFGPAHVTCMIEPPSGPRALEALRALRDLGVRLIEADLDYPVTAEPEVADVVFHLAANTNTRAFARDLRVNHDGTKHLLDWLCSGPRSNARVVYASSVAVHDRDRPPTTPICEESPLVPRTAYGKTKLAGENIVHQWTRAGFGTSTIVRLPTVYGPGQKSDGLFATFIRPRASQRWLVRVNWPGRTSIMHVDDAADVMVDLGLRPEAANEVYCLASDESLTVAEIAGRIAQAVGRSHVPIHVPGSIWGMARGAVWGVPWSFAALPHLRQALWRLSLMVSDGFWVDAAKLRSLYSRPIRNLDQGLVDTLDRLDH